VRIPESYWLPYPGTENDLKNLSSVKPPYLASGYETISLQNIDFTQMKQNIDLQVIEDV
jgi:hypothetical protein